MVNQGRRRSRNYFLNFVLLILMIWSTKAEEEAGDNRDSRLLPVFQVVRFPNDPCIIGSGSNTGPCNARICKLSSAICQIRLDLDTFIITGPSTAVTTNTMMLELGGMIRAANGGKIITQRTNCATDTMSIGNAPSVPVVCGTLTGDHIYFDASDSCHNLMLNFGQWSNDNTIPTTRQVSIKISQINCASAHRAPP